ncbi:type IX secretion system sortase PorU [Bizionia argentinensis JUB59]|uniref:Type IX secretion system sortase PorU n=1 Tax=Bizionia argentinensis JUB59 TaxID=1046627 RepID=G2EAD9_9FLAO|nr:type IX secretion system sortase PorU [Bizionia argentinensis]EGV44614.1 type IX secretion system sortase PorU [Bizionia argentinensis JUB59]
MKKRMFLLIMFVSAAVFSQQKQFDITWNGTKTFSNESFSLEIPVFNEEYFSYDLVQGVEFIAQWSISQLINENSVQISNVRYTTISKSELRDVDLATIPNQLKFNLKNSISRDNRSAFLTVSAIISENGTFKKLTAFTISYGAQNNLRSGNRFAISNSVLVSGSWYKFQVDKSGVFKISRQFLQRLGIDMDVVDPRTMKLFGNGGRMIPYANSEPYPMDLQENAIQVIGESDGYFHDSDYILFYAEGPNRYDADSNTNINIYNTATNYYINISPGNGKRIQPIIQPSGASNMMISTFQDYKYHEVDEYNLVSVGRRWFGDRFDVERIKTFDFSFPNLITTIPIKMKAYVASTSEISSSMELKVNNTSIANLILPAVSNANLATQAVYNNNVNVTSSNVSVTLGYDNGGNPSALAYIDYISVEATRELKFAGGQFTFYNRGVINASGIGEYNLTNAAEVKEIWDVTDIYNVQSLNNTNSNTSISFKAILGSLKTYAVIPSSGFYEPILVSNPYVSNQNLKGTIFKNAQGNFQDVDYIIITPSNLYAQAERLAQINRNQYNLNVKVVKLKDIYIEFGPGTQDIGAIRNFIKYVYENASAPDKRIKYLCMFGDGSFDYKDRIRNNTNIAPSWHAYDSFTLTSSYVSDDFFGMMDSNEGDMHSSNKLDIAIGRILANSPQQAKEMVDKVASYYIEESYGNWRNNVLVISDDVDEAWEKDIQLTTNTIGDNIAQAKDFINVTKIHSDAFVQESSAGGDRYPAVTTAITNAIEKGALVVNYFGHGGEDGLANERIFEKPDVQKLNNVCKLNCFVTVTCEYTRFDNPLRPTAGEYTYWNKDGGAIALITTTRQIYVNVGISFNLILEEYLFSFNPDDEYADDEYPSMAEALRLTKTDPGISGMSQRRLVFFIGDPAMKLAFPKPNVRLTKVNDIPVSQTTPVLKALSRAKISGEVRDASGNIMSDYTGVLSVNLYDKKIERTTLGNDGVKVNNQLLTMDFETLGATIFRGQASITNGQFEFEFIVPRDIGIPEGKGRISFYAKRDNALEDQSGADNSSITIGGLNPNAPEDAIGPEIQLYMNDENFVSGGITNKSPSLLVKLEDENGINTASGIGHDIVAVLDGDETNPYILNDYYQTEIDDFQRGTANYPLRNLEPGLHTLKVKAWDVYNNSSTSEIQFMVHDENQSLVIENVLNYPNPFVNYTEFWFNHNSSDVLDVLVQIFTVSGKLVKTLNGQTNSLECCGKGTSALSRDIVWDGRDDFGDKIGKGVYIYKLTVRSPILNKSVEKIEKLVIL